MALTQVQSFITRYLWAVDNTGQPGPGPGIRPRGGLLGSVEALQALNIEGVVRGWLSPDGGITAAANPPQNADFTAAGSAMTAAQFATLVATLQALNATVTASSNAIMTVLYTVRS